MKEEINFHSSSPILRVKNLEKSIDYYTTNLRFTVDWMHEKVVASVSRGKANIMLCEGDQGQGKSWIYIGVGDTECLYQEYKLSGAIIRQKPTNFS